MSEGGWSEPEPGWGEDGRRREELPKLEDLPIAEQGYDREAVRDAFDSFYRHAAQLDATLRILEGVEVFGRQARELRADIRSLRAASWGPAPSARHVWSVGHEVWSPQEPPAAFAASLPRLAVWAALIVAVGVGAAIAELSTVLIVLLVVAAWALVALIEVALASRRAGAVPAPLAPAEPAEVVAEPVAAAAAQETMIVPAGEAAAAREAEIRQVEPEGMADAEAESEPAEPEPVATSAEDGQPPAPEPEPAELQPVGLELAEPAEPEAAGPEPAEPEPVVTSAEDGQAAAHEVPPRRFWQRRAERVPDDTDAVPVVAPAPWRSDKRAGDPWEDDPASEETGDPLVTAPPPSRGLLRRGRR